MEKSTEIGEEKESTTPLLVPQKLEGINNNSSQEEQALKDMCELRSVYNAPMLVSFVFKNVHEEPTLVTGMNFMLTHMESGEGCDVLLANGAIEAVVKAHSFYKDNPTVHFLCVSILRRLLDCNFTRDKIIGSTDIMRIAFGIGHVYMDKEAHVEMATHCVMQCSRSEICRRDIMDRRIVKYCSMFCEKYLKNISIVRSVLKLYNWVTTTRERIQALCQDNCVSVTLKCMARHKANAGVLAPAILFLTRAANGHPPAMDYILKKKAIPVVIDALKSLHSNDVLQLEGLKMLQTMSRTTEGWKQISDTRGGWQSICQGTSLGDALVHELPGELHNPGWCIGDTPHMPLLDRQRIKAAEASSSKIQLRPKLSWTVLSLQAYMGLGGKAKTLSVNTEALDIRFDLLGTLDLLPAPGEEKEDWFQRVARYEEESLIKLDDMVSTVQEMRRKESKDAKQAALKDLIGAEEYVKPVFVMGAQVTSESLAKADMDVSERLEGVV